MSKSGSAYMKPEEVCERLGIHYNTLFRWRGRQVGPKFIVSPTGRCRYPRDLFELWFNENMKVAA